MLNRIPPGTYVESAVADLDIIRQLPWPDLKFDDVLCLDVLEHLADPEAALRLAVSGLDNGGIAVISLPNVANIRVRLALLAGRFQYQESGILDRTHRRLYTFASALELAHAAGLHVERMLSSSDRFGRLLNRSRVIGRLGRGLLAYNIVLVCRRDDRPDGATQIT